MKTLVVGYGSIGSRHSRLLQELGCETAVVSRRSIEHVKSFSSLEEALGSYDPSYIVVASRTSEHRDVLIKLSRQNYKGVLLVEKPLFSRCEEIPANSMERILVGYNFRFHPLLRRLKEILKQEKTISAQCYVGQYLPEWRPGTDYRDSYSAQSSAGGGVLRDLSHELDFCQWLWGEAELVSAIGGHFSHLQIDSDDVYGLMLRSKRCPLLTLQLNYLDRVSRREILVNTDRCTLRADLIAGTLEIDKKTERYTINRDETFRAQHQAVLSRRFDELCSLDEGLSVMRLIDAAERSSLEACRANS